MNATLQTTDGIHPDSFPPEVPVYSGHYHRPHTVKGTNIRYVGSPYQGWTQLKCETIVAAAHLLPCFHRAHS